MKPRLVSCVVGARPNFIKMASLLFEVAGRPGWKAHLIHTGQHYSPDMSDTFFEELSLPRPDVNLEVGGGSHTQQTAEIMRRIEPVFLETKPDLVLVVGDVNSTLASALVASKLGIRVAHVEAGLRSFDRTMPEEINRLVTDAISDYLFPSEPSGEENLLREGVDPKRIFLVGNTMIDTLLRFRERALATSILSDLDLSPKGYAVATLHRPANVDDPERLTGLLDILEKTAERLPVVFPMHPRTRSRVPQERLDRSPLRIIGPQGYLDFLNLTAQARLVLTDSGGIQEETTILGVPCLTIRENTERPITTTEGTNKLVGVDPQGVFAAIQAELDGNAHKAPSKPALWDGQAAKRIFDALEQVL